MISCHEVLEYRGRLSFVFEHLGDNSVPLSHIIESEEYIDDDFCKYTIYLVIKALSMGLTISVHDIKAANIVCIPESF